MEWFTVSAAELKVEAGRPHFLEERQAGDRHHDDNHDTALERREQFLANRSHNGRRLVEHAKYVQFKTKRSHETWRRRVDLLSDAKVSRAERARKQRLSRRETRAAAAVSHARMIADRQRRAEQVAAEQLDESLSAALDAASGRRERHLDNVARQLSIANSKAEQLLREREKTIQDLRSELQDSIDAASERRNQRLRSRSAKSALHLSKFQARGSEHRKVLSQLQHRLDHDLQAAEARRQARLEIKRQRCAKHWSEVLRKRIDSSARTPSPLLGSADKDLSASVIQSAWRWSKLAHSLEFLRSSSLQEALTTVKPSYEFLADVLQDKEILGKIRSLLKSFHRFAPSMNPIKSPHRVLLSALMMVFQPRVIFSDAFGDAEQQLQSAALDLVGTLRAWLLLSRFPKHAIRERQLSNFATTWCQFKVSFLDWKRQDRERLIAGMVEHYNELNALKQSIQAGGSSEAAEAEWFPHVNRQQQLIRNKLAKLNASDRITQVPLSAPATPRPGTPESTSSESDQSFAAAKARAQGRRRPRTISDEHKRPLPAQPAAQDPNVNDSISNGLLNAELAHEIALNDNFELPETVNPEQTAQTEKLHAALQKNPTDPQTLVAVIADIRSALFDTTLPRHERFRQQISERLDTDLILQQIEHSAFDFASCQSYIVETIMKLCAPSRDEEASALRQASSIPEFYSAATEVLRHMRVDMANFHIRSIQPYIKQYAVEYEQEKFKQGITSGTISLEKTKAWLKEAEESLDESKTNPLEVYTQGLHDLLWKEDVLSNCPETWLMDKHRIQALRVKLNVSALVACVYTLITCHLKVLKQNKAFEKEFCHNLEVIVDGEARPFERLDNVTLEAISVASRYLALTGQPLTEDHRVRLTEELSKLSIKTHPVRKLLTRRLHDVCKKLFREATPSLDLPALSHGSFPLADILLSRHLKALGQILIHHRAVFGLFYDELLA